MRRYAAEETYSKQPDYQLMTCNYTSELACNPKSGKTIYCSAEFKVLLLLFQISLSMNYSLPDIYNVIQ